MKIINKFAISLKRLVIFIGSIVFIIVIYINFLPDVWQRNNTLVSLIIVWLITAYGALPYIHRFLSRIYVPDNFIGRARTVDGILSDPVNMSVRGTKRDLVAAMESAGWRQAEDLSISTIWKMIRTTALKQSYNTAPVSDAFLFGKKQDLAFQMQVDNTPRKRHHVRFWKTPTGWFLPGGYKVDWIGAATYDDAVGFSLFTLQVTHRIDANVDKERNFIIQTLQEANRLENTQRIEHFFNAYKTRNGGGHHYITDGSMVIADLKKG